MTYAAALHLTMANALFPSSSDDRSYQKDVHAILDELILCGNRIADARKQELNRIEDLFREFTRRVEQEGLQLLTLPDSIISDNTTLHLQNTAQSGEASVTESGSVPQSSCRDHQPLSVDSSALAHADFLDSIGISSYEFLSIVDQINHPDIPYGDLDVSPDWMAGGNMTDSFG